MNIRDVTVCDAACDAACDDVCDAVMCCDAVLCCDAVWCCVWCSDSDSVGPPLHFYTILLCLTR